MTTQAYSLPRVNDIPEPVESETKRVGAPLPDESLEADWPTLAVLSRRYIDRALQHTRGNKTRAADLLGIDRRTLNRILVRDRVRRAKPRTE
jgi:DNA-binding NtrC family response regulator